MAGHLSIRWLAGAIGWLGLSAAALGVSAQVTPYYPPVASNPPVATGGQVMPAAYQTPAVAQATVSAEAQTPQASQTSPAGRQSSFDAPSLSPPKNHDLASHNEPGKDPDKQPGGIQSALTVGGSLAVVLGIFFAIVWVLRRASPNGFGTLPGAAFEVLGRAALANRQQVHLLRCGNKILLVSVTATGAQTLTEITDPSEVERLAALCRQNRGKATVTSLRDVFRRAGRSDG